MHTILIVIHLFVALAMVVVILLQRSEGGALSGLGGGGPMGLISAKGAGNILTRLTAIFGTIFMIVSLILALMSRPATVEVQSILDEPAQTQNEKAPVSEQLPSAPLSKD